jgi:hypothetical protein
MHFGYCNGYDHFTVGVHNLHLSQNPFKLSQFQPLCQRQSVCIAHKVSSSNWYREDAQCTQLNKGYSSYGRQTIFSLNEHDASDCAHGKWSSCRQTAYIWHAKQCGCVAGPLRLRLRGIAARTFLLHLKWPWYTSSWRTRVTNSRTSASVKASPHRYLMANTWSTPSPCTFISLHQDNISWQQQ